MRFEICDFKKVEAMKYERFEDLPVWQLAADLAVSVFEWTQQPSFRGKGDLAADSRLDQQSEKF